MYIAFPRQWHEIIPSPLLSLRYDHINNQCTMTILLFRVKHSVPHMTSAIYTYLSACMPKTTFPKRMPNISTVCATLASCFLSQTRYHCNSKVTGWPEVRRTFNTATQLTPLLVYSVTSHLTTSSMTFQKKKIYIYMCVCVCVCVTLP